MKLSSLKIFYLIKSFKNKAILLMVVAIVVATFCLPKFSSFAYFEYKILDYYQDIRVKVSQSLKPKPETMKLYVTAYSSTAEQTDDTPCIASNGYDLCKHNKENVIACNFLPMGTKVKFPELDPHKIYTVVDRMHERYNSRMDIWMRSTQDAKDFGLQYLEVEIYK